MEPKQVDITRDEVLDDGVGQDLVSQDARRYYRCWQQVSMFDDPAVYRVYRFDGVRWSRVGEHMLIQALAYCGAPAATSIAPAVLLVAAGMSWALASWRHWRALCETLDQFYQN